MVDRFIDDATEVRVENLSGGGRNELEVNFRFCMETHLVPGLLAVLALLWGLRLRPWKGTLLDELTAPAPYLCPRQAFVPVWRQ